MNPANFDDVMPHRSLGRRGFLFLMGATAFGTALATARA
jgi:uncharacterized membrane protein